ncbi:MAG: hypothetical protein LBL76_04775 [Treponema sp.]|jgi:hypothetical protein|nr:hypothetical protein [Treponema sp.]
MDEDSITSIYCDVDDFGKAPSLPRGRKKSMVSASRLSLSEVMTIILLFHLGSFLPVQVSYNRFVELTNCALISLISMLFAFFGPCSFSRWRVYYIRGIGGISMRLSWLNPDSQA